MAGQNGTVDIYTKELNADGYGDFVKCSDCERKMLIGLGKEIFLSCSSRNLTWADESAEHTAESSRQLGYKGHDI